MRWVRACADAVFELVARRTLVDVRGDVRGDPAAMIAGAAAILAAAAVLLAVSESCMSCDASFAALMAALVSANAMLLRQGQGREVSSGNFLRP